MDLEDDDYDVPSQIDFEFDVQPDQNLEYQNECFSEPTDTNHEIKNEQTSLNKTLQEKNASIKKGLLEVLVNRINKTGRNFIFDEDMDFLFELYMKHTHESNSSRLREVLMILAFSLSIYLRGLDALFVTIPLLLLVFRQKLAMFVSSSVLSKYLFKVDELLSKSKQLVRYLKQIEQVSLSSEREFNIRDGVKIDLNLRDNVNTKYRKELLLRTRKMFFSLKELNSSIIDKFDLSSYFN
jgi:hypothetical protein